jgi:trans-aconitate 2-methyltransferase
MPSWDSTQYLRFAGERTQPAVDLAARIALAAPRRGIDLGCGPGNSTAVLARRWPAADLSGLDSSTAMIEAARKEVPQRKWQVGDIASWSANEPFDVIFSNAALQWVPDHARVLPHLFDQVAPGGALAFQMPANFDAPAHRVMRELGASGRWRSAFLSPPREWHSETRTFYYDLLAPRAARVDLWTTEYVHVLSGPEEIVEWYRGTGLRPWLDALPDDAARAQFSADYLAAIAAAYPRQPDGRVLFPFLRLFVVAYRGS